MPEYVRVKDTDTGHELSVLESELPHGNYEVLKEAAVEDRTGLPLPPKHATPKSLSSTSTTSGQSAEIKKENKHA